jgi:hypothetical protein
MEKTATHYLFEALFVLKDNISYVFIPVILTSGLYLYPLVSGGPKVEFFAAVGIALFIIMPLLYGQFIEIISTGRKDTWRNVFQHYWLRVFLVSLILKAPTILLSLFAPEMSNENKLLSCIIEVVSIYILPLVLLKKEIISSFELGFKCLLGNLKFSLPLVSLLVFSFILPTLVAVVLKIAYSLFLVYTFSVILIISSTFIDFALFVAASLILKDKLLKDA